MDGPNHKETQRSQSLKPFLQSGDPIGEQSHQQVHYLLLTFYLSLFTFFPCTLHLRPYTFSYAVVGMKV